MFDAERLRAVMAAQGRRVDWLAEMTEYAPETVSRFLTGADSISERFATRAARALGVPLDWLRVQAMETANAA